MNRKTPKEILFTVTDSAELLPFLLEKLARMGRNRVKAMLARGQISIDGKVETKYNARLSSGQTVSVSSVAQDKQSPIRGLEILYEDEDLIVIDKQAGLLSIASEKEKHDTAYSFLMEHVRKTNPRNRVFVVHRLDRDTSGVMLYAKSEKVQQALQQAWKEAVPERTYIALVEGSVKQEEGTHTSWLKESKTLKMFSSPVPNDGQKAVTHFKVLQKTQAYSLLEIRLDTGRKNQIRVHMQDLGHPVVGDKKYGSRQNPIGRLGLHAQVIAFYHPATGKLMRFAAKLPEAFLRVFKSA